MIRAFYKRVLRGILPAFCGLVFIFIYLPIMVLIVFSFNKVAFPYRWVGFSLQWYHELFRSPEIWVALKNSLFVAISSAFLSLSMGLLFLFYGARTALKKLTPLFYANLIVPEIFLAVGLLSVFTCIGLPRGLGTLIVAHTILGMSFAIPILATRFAELEASMVEASLDLGATLTQTFFRVIIPLMRPALVAAGLLVFIISFDDYIIAFFCTSATVQTLPLYIFAMVRTGVSPVINALSAGLLLFSSLLVMIVYFLRLGKRIV